MLLLSFSAAGSKAAWFEFTNNLTLGTQNGDVSVLQQFLITGGFLKIPAPNGYFGPMTKTSLGAWQASVGIFPSTGFFGPVSREKINAIFQQAIISTTHFPNTGIATATPAGQLTSVPIAKIADGSPVRLRIPRLNIDAVFQYNGLKTDGTMEIPSNIVDVGWFTGSPRPGEKGNSIITGHVAQIRGGKMTKPGVFSNLHELSEGDTIYILNDKGETAAFVVRISRSFDPAADATDVFTAKDSSAHLNLITCEGTWNPAELSYSQRLVIFTDAIR